MPELYYYSEALKLGQKAARAAALEEATLYAASVPLKTMEAALKALPLALEMAQKGNPASASDAGVAALAAVAGIPNSVEGIAQLLTRGQAKYTDYLECGGVRGINAIGTGIDVDILAAIAEDQGFTYDLNSLGWDSAIAACQAGQADGMIAGASITDERKSNGWIFSDGYYQATQCMAVAADSDIAGFDALSGQTVAVKTGTQGAAYAESLKDQYGFEITYMDDSPTMYQAVTGGQAVACFEDTPIMADSIKSGVALKIVEGSENEGSPYGFAVFSADKQELIDLFNAGLANIKANGKYDEILAKYLG